MTITISTLNEVRRGDGVVLMAYETTSNVAVKTLR